MDTGQSIQLLGNGFDGHRSSAANVERPEAYYPSLGRTSQVANRNTF